MDELFHALDLAATGQLLKLQEQLEADEDFRKAAQLCLDAAVSSQQPRVIRWLLERSAQLQNAVNLDRLFRKAMTQSSFEVLEALLDGCGTSQKRLDQVNSLLLRFANDGNLNGVEWAIQTQQADQHHGDEMALQLAVASGKLAVVQWLVDVAGCDLETLDGDFIRSLKASRQRWEASCGAYVAARLRLRQAGIAEWYADELIKAPQSVKAFEHGLLRRREDFERLFGREKPSTRPIKSRIRV